MSDGTSLGIGDEDDPVDDQDEQALLVPSVRQALHDLNAGYVVVACDEDLSESEAFAAAYGYRPEQVANTVIVKVRAGSDVSYAACMALSSTRLDLNHRLKRHLGVRKISFASSDETSSLTGMEVVSVGPVGLPENLPIYVDLRVLDQSWVIVGSGFRR